MQNQAMEIEAESFICLSVEGCWETVAWTCDLSIESKAAPFSQYHGFFCYLEMGSNFKRPFASFRRSLDLNCLYIPHASFELVDSFFNIWNFKMVLLMLLGEAPLCIIKLESTRHPKEMDLPYPTALECRLDSRQQLQKALHGIRQIGSH